MSTKPVLLHKASRQLEVTVNKTTHLVFPEAIVSIDRGSPDLLVQKAEGADHILRVKAAVKAFAATTLGVITRGGQLYTFLVCYSTEPGYYNWQLGGSDRVDGDAAPVNDGPEELESRILQKESNVNGPSVSQSGISLKLTGIYQQESNLFMRLQVENPSEREYRVSQLRLFIRARKRQGKVATQEKELPGVSLLTGEDLVVKSKDIKQVVLALPYLTLDKGHYLALEAVERAGGRSLLLKVKKRRFLQCENLNPTHPQ